MTDTKRRRRPRGSGSVFQRGSDGRWVAQLYQREDGVTRSRQWYFRDEDKAHEHLNLMLELRGESLTPEQETIEKMKRENQELEERTWELEFAVCKLADMVEDVGRAYVNYDPKILEELRTLATEQGEGNG